MDKDKMNEARCRLAFLDRITACRRKKEYVFISYSSDDWKVVFRDVYWLQSLGYNIWLDERNLDKTKPDWHDNVYAAIAAPECCCVLFYVSRYSMASENCLSEIRYTTERATRNCHGGRPVPFIAVNTEPISNIVSYYEKEVHDYITGCTDTDRQAMFDTAANFIEEIFDNNNSRVRANCLEWFDNNPERYLLSLCSDIRQAGYSGITIPEHIEFKVVNENPHITKAVLEESPPSPHEKEEDLKESPLPPHEKKEDLEESPPPPHEKKEDHEEFPPPPPRPLIKRIIDAILAVRPRIKWIIGGVILAAVIIGLVLGRGSNVTKPQLTDNTVNVQTSVSAAEPTEAPTETLAEASSGTPSEPESVIMPAAVLYDRETLRGAAIRYLLDKIDAGCPIASYDTDNPMLADVAYTEDNALAALALMSAGEREAAQKILDGFLKSLKKDLNYDDRLRNAYEAGNPAEIPSFAKPDGSGTTRDQHHAGASARTNAMAAIALLCCGQNDDYIAAAESILNWVISDCMKENGFAAGYDGWPEYGDMTTLKTQNAADNMLLYSAFTMMNRVKPEAQWTAAAERAKACAEGLFDTEAQQYASSDDPAAAATAEAQAYAALILNDFRGIQTDIQPAASTEAGVLALAAAAGGEQARTEAYLQVLLQNRVEIGAITETVGDGRAAAIAPTSWFLLTLINTNPFGTK